MALARFVSLLFELGVVPGIVRTRLNPTRKGMEWIGNVLWHVSSRLTTGLVELQPYWFPECGIVNRRLGWSISTTVVVWGTIFHDDDYE